MKVKLAFRALKGVLNVGLKMGLEAIYPKKNLSNAHPGHERIHESLGYKTPYEIYFKKLLEQQLKQAA